MKRLTAFVAVVILVSCVLAGCDLWMSGEYLSVTPHAERIEQAGDVITEVSSYNQLRDVLNINISSCAEKIIVSTSSFNDAMMDFYVQTAISQITTETPIGAYAVDSIDYEIGTNRGVPVVVFKITYRYPATNIFSIRRVHSDDEIVQTALNALREGGKHLVLRTDDYTGTDVVRQIENYIMTHGDELIETPGFSLSSYPKKGSERIIDIVYDYESDPQSLSRKRVYVEKVLLEWENKNNNRTQVLDVYEGFYKLLSESASYSKNSSITPVYSLLQDKAGDSKAFAMTFAALCRRNDLDALVISGTYQNEEHCWNIVRFRGMYYHLDILACIEAGEFDLKAASEMSGYFWDVEKYPTA